ESAPACARPLPDPARNALARRPQYGVMRRAGVGQRSPAPLAPLGQRGPLRTERRVIPVARVHPGRIVQDLEEPLLDVIEQLGEALRVLLGVAHPAGEEGVAGEEVVARLPAAPQHRDRAGSVTAQVDDLDRL